MEHAFDGATYTGHVGLLDRNEFSASQRRQITGIVLSLGMRGDNGTRDTCAERSQARTMTAMMNDQVRLVLS